MSSKRSSRPSSSRMRTRRWLPAGVPGSATSRRPDMRRCTASPAPLSKEASRYLPRRATEAKRCPGSKRQNWREVGCPIESGRRTSTKTILLPGRRESRPLRTVSTSGSSGTFNPTCSGISPAGRCSDPTIAAGPPGPGGARPVPQRELVHVVGAFLFLAVPGRPLAGSQTPATAARLASPLLLALQLGKPKPDPPADTGQHEQAQHILPGHRRQKEADGRYGNSGDEEAGTGCHQATP